ncbi:MAG: glycosyltransferase [Deltaproteobacteria bacterium]|nr:glycosyltransferase [Deltaproteobacteria bacterium]
MSGTCDVVIPVKNAVWWMDWCLRELFQNTDPALLGSVLVVDDGSDDHSLVSLEKICASFPKVRLLRNSGRSGYGGACNFGASQSDAPYILFLNSDCLVTSRAIEKLMAACESDSSIGLACPLSNNSDPVTIPMLPGQSYAGMNRLVERATADLPLRKVVLEACTVAGNCLIVTGKCWTQTGGFAGVWGKGYGEETDLQMRALDDGFRGVVAINTYVYHFGGGTFRYEEDVESLRLKNHRLFFSVWREKFGTLLERVRKNDPIQTISGLLERVEPKRIEPDVLFVLPGISQAVGGIHVVIDLCNHLIRRGIEARCVVFGQPQPNALQPFREPILFGLLWSRTETDLLIDRFLSPKLVVSTLFTTVFPAFALSQVHDIPLVNLTQGYEFFFERGSRYRDVADSYQLADELIVTSRWLAEGAAVHAERKPTTVLPIGIDRNVFSAGDEGSRLTGKLRVGFVLRSDADKGQAVLIDILTRLLPFRGVLSITVVGARSVDLCPGWDSDPDTVLIEGPVDRGKLAEHLRRCDVFVDTSPHEGFGLVPLEAMSCGAVPVVADSGGVREYLEDGVNGILVTATNHPSAFVAALVSIVQDRTLLGRMREAAIRTAARFSAASCFEQYANFIERALSNRRVSSAPIEARLGQWTLGERSRLTVEHHASVVTIHQRVQARLAKRFNANPSNVCLRVGQRGILCSPRVEGDTQSGGTPLVLRRSSSGESAAPVWLPLREVWEAVALVGFVDIEAPAATIIEVALARNTETEKTGQGLRILLRPGRNRLFFDCGFLDGARWLLFRPGDALGEYLLHVVELRENRLPAVEAADTDGARELAPQEASTPDGHEAATHEWFAAHPEVLHYLLSGEPLPRVPEAPSATETPSNFPADALQVFWTEAGEISERTSAQQAFLGGAPVHRYVFALPETARGPLRLDPGRRPSVFEIKDATLFSETSGEEERGLIAQWSNENGFHGLKAGRDLLVLSSRDTFRCLCLGDDPQIWMDVTLEPRRGQKWTLVVRASRRDSIGSEIVRTFSGTFNHLAVTGGETTRGRDNVSDGGCKTTS